jgi:hypothetical protein
MARERRNQLVLGALAIALAAVAYQQWPRTTTIEAPAASNDVQGTARTSTGKPSMTAPDVHLKALEEEWPKPGEVERNLFRFKPKPVPPLPAPVERMPPAAPPPVGPPPPPGVPPIALKFITLIERPDRGGEKIALLSDGRGGPSIFGKEGDVIEGRYKIVRIGTESIEVAYLDGHGRQTIRLTGQ